MHLLWECCVVSAQSKLFRLPVPAPRLGCNPPPKLFLDALPEVVVAQRPDLVGGVPDVVHALLGDVVAEQAPMPPGGPPWSRPSAGIPGVG